MTLLALFASLAVVALSLFALFDTLAGNGRKIAAALSGHSLLSEPVIVTRPVMVRMASRRVSRPLAVQPRLRAAA
jgi:hypothetical protein